METQCPCGVVNTAVCEQLDITPPYAREEGEHEGSLYLTMFSLIVGIYKLPYLFKRQNLLADLIAVMFHQDSLAWVDPHQTVLNRIKDYALEIMVLLFGPSPLPFARRNSANFMTSSGVTVSM